MNKLVVWRVQGWLRKSTEGRYSSKRDFRDVLLAVKSDMDAEDVMAVAGDALLHNWSSTPHTAEVVSLGRVKGDGGMHSDQMEVITL